MSNVAEDNRNITRSTSAIITVIMTALFAAVWLFYYNNIVFRTHRFWGAIFSILIWMVLYLVFSRTYRAHKIASCVIGEIAFSQFLSIAFPDFILYVAGCLTARRYMNIFPGAGTVVLQIIVGFIWATKAKQYFLTHVEPRECLLLYDADINDEERVNARGFTGKLEQSYGHLFHITDRVAVGDDVSEALAEVYQYPVVFLYDMAASKRSEIVKYCVNTGKRVYITPTIEDIIARGYKVKHFVDTPLFAYNGVFKDAQSYPGKRVLDIVVSVLMLIVTSPIMLIAAIAIKLEDGGTVFFKQKRVGQGGKVFDILKFRSMVMDAEADGKPHPAVAGDPRITKVGKILRATRLDELPQIFNILSGDLSLVGPRPERIEHHLLYTKDLPEFSYRLRVPAGLTGYAQIYGKYNTSARNKLLLDLLYIEQQSLLMDLRIIFLTVKIMFTPESTEGFEEDISKMFSEESGAAKTEETAIHESMH